MERLLVSHQPRRQAAKEAEIRALPDGGIS